MAPQWPLCLKTGHPQGPTAIRGKPDLERIETVLKLWFLTACYVLDFAKEVSKPGGCKGGVYCAPPFNFQNNKNKCI